MPKDETHVDADGRTVRISSPGKVMFPEQGWTKMDVVEHYLTTGPGALRGVKDRPCMLKRWPQGVAGGPFYHKRPGKAWKGDLADIRFPSQRPGQMAVARDLGDVVTMAQLNCLDLNPWPVRADDTNHPDELRIDLDPTDGVPFAEVRGVAGVVRDILAAAGLVGWPKTSGNRGIHVYARIDPRWTFHQVRRAGLAVAREAERRDPRATTAWWKEERDGVFIDYNQNARDKTIASAYGVRQTGYVSAPFFWNELDDVSPEDFPLGTFADRWAAVGDPSDGIDEAAGSLDTLLEWVARDEEQGLGDAPWPPHYPKQPGEPPRVQPSKKKRDA